MTTTTNPSSVPVEVEEIQRRYAQALAEHAAGNLPRGEQEAQLDALRVELDAFNAAQDHGGCPRWCNAHEGYPMSAEDNAQAPHHRHRAQGENWYFDVETMNDPTLGPVTFAPMEYREMTLQQARDYAHAVIAALDEVEGVGASGRAARRLYERLTGTRIDVDAFQAACDALGVDVFEMITGTGSND